MTRARGVIRNQVRNPLNSRGSVVRYPVHVPLAFNGDYALSESLSQLFSQRGDVCSEEPFTWFLSATTQLYQWYNAASILDEQPDNQ